MALNCFTVRIMILYTFLSQLRLRFMLRFIVALGVEPRSEAKGWDSARNGMKMNPVIHNIPVAKVLSACYFLYGGWLT